MKVTTKFEFTPKERELLLLFKKKIGLTTYDNFAGWRDTPEWSAFVDKKLIYHCNRHSEGAYIRYELTELGQEALKSVTKYPRVNSVKQIAVIVIPSGKEYPHDSRTKIVLDSSAPIAKKEHQILFQQGPRYGSVGDYCYSVDHEELFELERKGMIKINP